MKRWQYQISDLGICLCGFMGRWGVPEILRIYKILSIEMIRNANRNIMYIL